MSLPIDNNYQNILSDLKGKIRKAKYRASLKLNFELLRIYWEIGNTILEQQKQAGWGAKIIDTLALTLKLSFLILKGYQLEISSI